MNDEDYATVRGGGEFGFHLDTDGQLPDALPNTVDEYGVDALPWWWFDGVVFDTDHDPSPSGVRERDAILGDLGPVRRAPGDLSQGLVVQAVPFLLSPSCSHQRPRPRVPVSHPTRTLT